MSVSMSALSQSLITHVGIEVGLPFAENISPQATRLLSNQLGGAVQTGQRPSVTDLKLVLGHRGSSQWDFDVAWLQSATARLNYTGTTANGTGYYGSGTQQFAGLEFATNWRPDPESGWNDFFLRLGGHLFEFQQNLGVLSPGPATYSARHSGIGTLWGVGVDSRIDPRWRVRLSLLKYDRIGGQAIDSTFYTLGLIRDF
jgi:hypothetical protein